ncbi:DUF4188 domain-containing protein [Haliangium sp.]|uniref:DUF4188 domain-containing protein n=1 Tax=Haliangium sp. TaxID=2663208 RepID=UPI003D0CBEC8
MTARHTPLTADIDGDFAVFLIGMRIRRWWRPDLWLPVAMAMPRMLRELHAKPELGMLGYESWPGRTTIMVQYWRSTDHLLRYARSRDSEHLPAWREFYRRAGASDAVGIWHETYEVAAGRHESIYHNMPAFGLGKAAGVVEAQGKLRTAAGRLGRGEGRDGDDAPEREAA